MQMIIQGFQGVFKNPKFWRSIALGALLGMILASAGITPFDWQLWAVLAIIFVME